MKRFAPLLACLLLVSCATPKISDRASRVLVVRQAGSLAANCARIGPITVSGRPTSSTEDALQAAIRLARERAAEQGATAVAVTGFDGAPPNSVTVHGVAFRCP